MNEDLQSPNSLIPQENVKILMEEALELAQTATTMDKQGKYPAASDYYDLTILNLNECLSLLPKDSDVYKSILVFREKYNRRIEILSEGGSITSLLNTSSNHYDGRNSLVDGDASFMREITPYDSLDASNNDTNNTKRTSSPQKSNKKPAKLSSQDFNYALDFNDPKCKVIPELEAPPTGIILHSFWQMRIRRNQPSTTYLPAVADYCGIDGNNGDLGYPCKIQLDSPATTNTITYTISGARKSGSGICYWSHQNSLSDESESRMVLMEVSA